MKSRFCRLIAAAAFVLGLAAVSPALAAQPCDPFNQTYVVGKGTAQQSLPSLGKDVLLDNRDAISCLVEVLSALRPRFAGAEAEPEDVARFIQATGALRTILANRGMAAIKEFRSADNIDTIATLVSGARNNNPTVRVNAALILSDVIDNSGLCVVIDHLYDPTLAESDSGASGRLNLLTVASVVAPWAYKENFDNLRRLQNYMVPIVERERDARQTRRVLANLIDRLDYQDKVAQPNKNEKLPRADRQCYDYQPVWANRSGQRLIYRD
jgi:hypothetical protein